MCDQHRFFFSLDGRFPSSWDSNKEAISRRIPGNWRVRCGHCGTAIAGERGHPGSTTEVLWKNEGAFLGTFTIL